MSWSFETDPEYQEKLDWVERFMKEEVEPLDFLGVSPYDVHDPKRNAAVKPLQAEVRRQGLWACHLGAELGGQGYGQVKLGLLNEILGRSHFGPMVFGCQAPDSGNAEILAHYGTPEQKARYLQPLLDNEIVSCFSMTEPQGGADPKVFTTTATQDGDHWVINGEKWYSSFASIASFIIVMAMTDPEAPPYQRYSMFVVPSDTPGINVLRDVGLAYTTTTCSVRVVGRSWWRRRDSVAAVSTTPCGLSGWCGGFSTCSPNAPCRGTPKVSCSRTSRWCRR